MTSSRPFNSTIIVEQGSTQGISWAVAEHPTLKALNGYVRVPQGHPWHGKHYDDVDADVPGGLTFSDGEWFGFDLIHHGNLWAGMPPEFMALANRESLEEALANGGDVPVVWALPDVIALTIDLAEQAARAAKPRRWSLCNWLTRILRIFRNRNRTL